MKRSKKIAMIVSVICILVGLCIMTAAWFHLRGTDPMELSTIQYEETIHTITEPFENIQINTMNSSIKILPSDDGTCRIVCDDNEKLYHEVTAEKGTLSIVQQDEWLWYETIGFGWSYEPTLTVYLPETEYNTLNVTASSGNVTVAPGFRFQVTSIGTASGDVGLSELSTEYLYITSSSGDISLRSVQAELDMYLETVSGYLEAGDLAASDLTLASSSGDIVLENAAAERLGLSTVSGDITVTGGSFSGTSYFETSSGYVEIRDSACGEQMLKTTSGDLTLRNVQNDTLNVSSSSGCLKLWNVICKGDFLFQMVSGDITFSGADAACMDIMTSSGDVSGTLLTSKNFVTDTSSGYVEVPPSVESAGTCSIQTVSGDIHIEIQP